MKFQLTLRDFFWLTIVVGLAIGLLIEHQDVQRLSGYQGKAEWWEKVARELGKEYQEKTGLNPEFKEIDNVSLRRPDGLLLFEKDFTPDQVHVWGTQEQSSTWPTGNADFDFVLFLAGSWLVGLCVGLMIIWFAPRLAPKQPPPTLTKSPHWGGYLFFGAFTAIFLVGSLAMFVFRQPFKGTCGLFFGFWFLSFIVPRYILARFFYLPPIPVNESPQRAT